MNQLYGGTICPNIEMGFHQASTTCWHDSLLMIFLYG